MNLLEYFVNRSVEKLSVFGEEEKIWRPFFCHLKYTSDALVDEKTCDGRANHALEFGMKLEIWSKKGFNSRQIRILFKQPAHLKKPDTVAKVILILCAPKRTIDSTLLRTLRANCSDTISCEDPFFFFYKIDHHSGMTISHKPTSTQHIS